MLLAPIIARWDHGQGYSGQAASRASGFNPLNPPFKDVINLRAASPTLLRAYNGENLVEYVKRRLPSDLTLLTMPHKLRA